MLAFRDASIKRKLTSIIMLTSSAALMLACMAFVTYEVVTFRRAMARNLSTLADIIRANSTAALSFNDQKSAEETLAALSAEPHIVSACIYGADGQVFAKYLRSDIQGQFSPPGPRGDGYHFEEDRLILFRRILLDGEKIGTLYLQSDLQEMRSRLTGYIEIVGIALLVSSFTAFVLSSKLQRVISEPILRLAHAARVVSLEKNYSLQVEQHSQDEVGFLIQGFNEMLTQIQARDTALQNARICWRSEWRSAPRSCSRKSSSAGAPRERCGSQSSDFVPWCSQPTTQSY